MRREPGFGIGDTGFGMAYYSNEMWMAAGEKAKAMGLHGTHA
jgi:hypothetical protein